MDTWRLDQTTQLTPRCLSGQRKCFVCGEEEVLTEFKFTAGQILQCCKRFASLQHLLKYSCVTWYHM